MKNREILFRGISVETKQWVYGVPLQDATSKTIYIVNNASVEFTGSPALWEVIPETVGQFTGLLDKNGKRIFEGDRIKSQFKGLTTLEEIEGIVEIDNCNPCFVIHYKYRNNGHDCYEYDFIQCGLRTNYIIGTIHDHFIEANNE